MNTIVSCDKYLRLFHTLVLRRPYRMSVIALIMFVVSAVQNTNVRNKILVWLYRHFDILLYRRHSENAHEQKRRILSLYRPSIDYNVSNFLNCKRQDDGNYTSLVQTYDIGKAIVLLRDGVVPLNAYTFFCKNYGCICLDISHECLPRIDNTKIHISLSDRQSLFWQPYEINRVVEDIRLYNFLPTNERLIRFKKITSGGTLELADCEMLRLVQKHTKSTRHVHISF